MLNIIENFIIDIENRAAANLMLRGIVLSLYLSCQGTLNRICFSAYTVANP